MKLHTVTCNLGPTSATLITNHHDVLDYLRNFYTFTTGEAGTGRWVIEAIVGDPFTTMTTNPWGVAYEAVPQSHRLRLRAPEPQSLAITTRKTVREALVDYCENRRYVMLHASAVVAENKVLIVVGDKGSGKTTLGLKAALLHGMRYLSNDHLIVYATDGAGSTQSRLALTSLPTPIPLKIGTYLDLEDRLPQPWDTENLDIDAHRHMPREQLYPLDRRVLYTFPGLGQQSPITVNLSAADEGPAVLVALAGYNAGETGETSIPDPVEALMPHVRTDWMFDPNLNQRYLPRHERQPAEYDKDARRLVAALAERATVIGWTHHGDPAGLLDHPSLKAGRS